MQLFRPDFQEGDLQFTLPQITVLVNVHYHIAAFTSDGNNSFGIIGQLFTDRAPSLAVAIMQQRKPEPCPSYGLTFSCKSIKYICR